MWYERDLDAMMGADEIAAITDGDGSASICLDLWDTGQCVVGGADGPFVDMLAAIILAVANLYYVFLYTIYLKPRTPQNIVIGGAAGAFPPMIGWAMATGELSVGIVCAVLVRVYLDTPTQLGAGAIQAR